jgi:two-component system cell cycle sensor histidine kinase/response regulator CckA
MIISRHNKLKPGEYVRVSVQDHGSGISPESISKIFDPYFSTKDTGSGLGLAVCFSVINKHGGIIYADSTPGRGTTIIFYLPVAEASKRRKHDVETNNIIRGSGQILVIDDDQSVGETMVSFLDELGYEPYFVTTGDESIRLLKEGSFFDAVITDLTIPGGIGGVEIKDQIRQIYPDMKIIVASGYSDDPVMTSYKEYGFNGMIRKPFRINVVSKVLYTVLQE